MGGQDGEGSGRFGRVTIEDVAERARVSVATVSRVVNGHPDVSAATRTEVLRLARELGYVSNRVPGAEPASRRSRLIALGVADIRGDSITDIITGAADALRARNLHLVMCPLDAHPNGSHPLAERLLQGTTGAALLVMPPEDRVDLLTLKDSRYPIVVVEPAQAIDSSIPSVTSTNWAGAKMAAEYLIALGHTHLGIITGPADWRMYSDRLAGYQAAQLAHGLPLVPKLVHESGLSLEGGQEAATRLLSLPHPPSAILAADDRLAVGVLRAAAAAGLTVPRDLSVVGFGDSVMTSVTTPPLTTVQQPLQGLGRVSADMLWRLLQGQQLDANRIELSTTLIERGSASRPRGASFLTI